MAHRIIALMFSFSCGNHGKKLNLSDVRDDGYVYGYGGTAEGDRLKDIENLYGSSHADHLEGDEGRNKLEGWKGDDTLIGGAGNDTLIGGAGDDTLIGGADDDILIDDGIGKNSFDGGEGTDTVSYAGAEGLVYIDLGLNSSGLLLGARGDSYNSIENVIGSDHTDFIFGTDGNNTFEGGKGADFILGRDGIDAVSYQASDEGVHVNLSGLGNQDDAGGGGLGGDAEGDRLDNIENLIGSNYADTLIGDQEGNVLNGSAGNDTLEGRGGANTLIGGSGNDIFVLDNVGYTNVLEDIALSGDMIVVADFENGIDKIRIEVSFDDVNTLDSIQEDTGLEWRQDDDDVVLQLSDEILFFGFPISLNADVLRIENFSLADLTVDDFDLSVVSDLV